MSKSLDTRLLAQFLVKAGRKLKGEWVLLGGTLLPAVGIDVRATVDIDLVGLGKKEAAQQLELMSLAESLGLPVESVNQAAAFFLKKIGYTKADLIVLEQGPSATIYRPSLSLYWRLKMRRLSETDLQDCEHYFNFCTSSGDAIQISELKIAAREASQREKSPAKLRRLKKLSEILGAGELA